MEKIFGKDGSASTVYFCSAIGADRQKEYFSPIGVLLAGLFSKLAWIFMDMRGLELYFRKVDLMGLGQGRMRLWPITIYSEAIRDRIYKGPLTKGNVYDEWHQVY
jgi:hypothetical protein